MKIHEYQAKELFKKYNIPIPDGGVAFNPDEAKKVAAMKKGGIHVCENLGTLGELCAEVF